jgi:hypothetical protein
MQQSLLVYEDMKILQKHFMLAIIFGIILCDGRIGFIFKYFVMCNAYVLGDDFFSGNSGKTGENRQEGPNLLSPITLDFSMIIQYKMM